MIMEELKDVYGFLYSLEVNFYYNNIIIIVWFVISFVLFINLFFFLRF